MSQFRGCILRRTWPVRPSMATPRDSERPWKAECSTIVKRDGLAFREFHGCITRDSHSYSYMTISYAQAHKSKNERVKIFDLAQFLIFFLILLILEEEEMWLCLCRWRLVYFRIREDRGEVNLLFEPRGVGMTLTLGGGTYRKHDR